MGAYITSAQICAPEFINTECLVRYSKLPSSLSSENAQGCASLPADGSRAASSDGSWKTSDLNQNYISEGKRLLQAMWVAGLQKTQHPLLLIWRTVP